MQEVELVEHLANRIGLSKVTAKDMVDCVFEVIGKALATGRGSLHPRIGHVRLPEPSKN